MLNKVVLMGRLTADPELKRTTSDIAVTSFRIAVGRNYSKDGAERQADFFNIVCWRSTAEFVSKYFSKGKMIVVAGSLQARTWVDKEGKNRETVEVIADEVHFADYSKREDSDALPNQMETYSSSGNSEDFQKIDDDDDDLPF